MNDLRRRRRQNPFAAPLARARRYITTVRTWVPGELVTASMMNTIRDLFNEIETGTANLQKANLVGRTSVALASDLSAASFAKVAYDTTLGKLVQSLNGGAYGSLGVNYSVVSLTDGATPALNAALGMDWTGVFELIASGDRTIGIPTNPSTGRRIIIRHQAAGAGRTVALNTGTGGFRFGSDIPALTQTVSGKVDYIGAIYHATANKWDVMAYTKGF